MTFETVLDLLLPRRCAGCSRPSTAWCADCARCFGAPFPVRRSTLPATPPAFAAAAYQGPARRAVLAAKERGRRDLLAVLASALAAALGALATGLPALSGPLWLVPAPSRASASRRRGGPHMTAVAERVARLRRGQVAPLRGGPSDHVQLPPVHVVQPLRLSPGARDSVGLGPAQRVENLRRHLTVLPRSLPPPGSTVVLLDDVITTGATASACADALRRAGARVHVVLACTAAV